MKGKGWFGLAVMGCVACCTLPFLLLGAGGFAAISADAWICGAILIGVAATGYFVMRKRAKAGCRTTGESGCSTDCGCQSS
jgi:hypothetical protein